MSNAFLSRFLVLAVFLAGPLPWIMAQEPVTAIQVKATDVQKNDIVRETVLFPGWDPYEPVSAFFYHKPKAEKLPVLIFIHGMGSRKSFQADWHRELAERDLAVISIDAHLSGDRAIATPIGGIKAEQNWVWPHQTTMNHTANDVSKMLDVLPTRPEFDPTRVAVSGFSMGGGTSMVLAWREPRISAIIPICGCVDFWWDVIKIVPGPEQDAKRAEFTPRLKQLVGSLNSNTPARMDAIPPKALLLLNGTKDHEIDIRSVRKFAEDMRPRYKDFPDRFDFVEYPDAGHQLTAGMKAKMVEWLDRHLVQKPIRVDRKDIKEAPAASH
jgi:pimeloyl-ACP methyl ester carboxylesterase